MKIAFFDCEEYKKDFFQQTLAGHELKFYQHSVSPAAIEEISDYEILSVRIHSKITREIIEKMPNLKCVATQSTGFDHIDLDACKQKDIVACNVPLYGENTVAEHTFALILALSRNVHKSYLRTISGDLSIEGLRGFDLQGKTLGVVGTGRIGLHVIRIAKAFGMKVIAFDVQRNEFLADVLGFEYVDFNSLLIESDIVTLHVPHNKHTHHLIDGGALRKMKKGALLINTARGAILDTQALIEALDEKLLAGAALDVIEKEDELLKAKKDDVIIKNHPLLFRDNVVYTPHIGSQSKEAQQRILDTTVENIKNFSEGKISNSVI